MNCLIELYESTCNVMELGTSTCREEKIRMRIDTSDNSSRETKEKEEKRISFSDTYFAVTLLARTYLLHY